MKITNKDEKRVMLKCVKLYHQHLRNYADKTGNTSVLYKNHSAKDITNWIDKAILHSKD